MPKPERARAIVLFSAGLDSTYNLLQALDKFSVQLALTFDYGQKAATQEVSSAAEIALQFDLRHEIVRLPWFANFTSTALLSDTKVPSGSEVEIDNLSRSRETAKNVWVPNRNGIFLNIAAGFAEGLGAEYVIPGFNSEEAQTFQDNSGAFLRALNTCWTYSTHSAVKTYCFTTELSKSEIVARGKSALPFAKLWPCYLAAATWCGECESCQRFRRALAANDLSFEELRTAVRR